MANCKSLGSGGEWSGSAEENLHPANKLLRSLDMITKAKTSPKVYTCYNQILKMGFRFIDYFLSKLKKSIKDNSSISSRTKRKTSGKKGK